MVIELAAALFANLVIYGGWWLRLQKLYTGLQNCDTIIHISISSFELISSSAGGPFMYMSFNNIKSHVRELTRDDNDLVQVWLNTSPKGCLETWSKESAIAFEEPCGRGVRQPKERFTSLSYRTKNKIVKESLRSFKITLVSFWLFGITLEWLATAGGVLEREEEWRFSGLALRWFPSCWGTVTAELLAARDSWWLLLLFVTFCYY